MAGEYLCPRFSARFIDGGSATPVGQKTEVKGRTYLRQASVIAVMDCPVTDCPIKFEDRAATGLIQLNPEKTAVLRTAETDALINAREGAQKFVEAKCPRIDRTRGKYKAPPFGR